MPCHPSFRRKPEPIQRPRAPLSSPPRPPSESPRPLSESPAKAGAHAALWAALRHSALSVIPPFTRHSRERGNPPRIAQPTPAPPPSPVTPANAGDSGAGRVCDRVRVGR